MSRSTDRRVGSWLLDHPPLLRTPGWMLTRLRVQVLAAIVGGSAFVVAAPMMAGERGLLLGAAGAVLFWSGAAHVYLSDLAPRHPERSTTWIATATGPRLRFGLRPHLPASLLAAGLFFLPTFGIAMLISESIGWPIGGGLVSLLSLWVFPDSVRALLATDRALLMDTRGLTYRGFSYELRVPWGQIDESYFAQIRGRQFGILIRVAPDAALTWRRRRWLVHLEPKPSKDSFIVPLLALDQPWAASAVISRQLLAPPDQRPDSFLRFSATMARQSAPPGG